MISASEPWTFEPFELPADGQRVRGQPTENDTGRSKLVPLLKEAIEKCHGMHISTRFDSSYTGGPCKNPHAVVEIGSWAGANAMVMADQLLAPEIYCVDHWLGGKGDCTRLIAEKLGPKTVFQGFCRNIGARLFTRIFPCVGKSRTWAEIWPFQVAAVFIDASHDYESVTEDIELWWPHVLPGGLFIGHDFTLFPDVERAVKDWFTRANPADLLNTHDELWWVWKPTEAQRLEEPF